MKKIILIIIFILLNSIVYTRDSDNIVVFCKIYIDNKEVDDMIYLKIILLKDNAKIKWYLNEVVFQTDELHKNHIISTKHSRYNDDYTIPLISDIKWEPGKSFECKYHYFHEPIQLKAIKKDEGKYDWEVYGSCRYKLRPDDPNDVEKFFEIKSVKEIKLKYKKVRLVNLYYK